jgi:hypothetical protein
MRETTSVRITREAHEILTELAERDGLSLTGELDKIIEEKRRERMFEQAREAYAELREDEEAWNELKGLQKDLEGTLDDGLIE